MSTTIFLNGDSTSNLCSEKRTQRVDLFGRQILCEQRRARDVTLDYYDIAIRDCSNVSEMPSDGKSHAMIERGATHYGCSCAF